MYVEISNLYFCSNLKFFCFSFLIAALWCLDLVTFHQVLESYENTDTELNEGII